jgi:DNA (cytosine-5)-methyltransferase 1
MKKTVPIIDIFAGPGGLGEGFSHYENQKVDFKIALSIEKDEPAHKTLELRAFVRQFKENGIPDKYYQYLSGKISREILFNSHPQQARAAKSEAWLHELEDGDIALVRRKARKALDKHDSKHWVLIGGPPCQAYSVVGRARMKNHKKGFEDDDRNYLYEHYLRLVAYLGPSIFIMENVKGFLTASVKGQRIFSKVLDDLERPGYAVKGLDKKQKAPSIFEYDIYSLVVGEKKPSRGKALKKKKLKPKNYIIHSEKFGVPQKRHRVILMGIRRDLDPEIVTHLKEKSPVRVKDVLDDLPKIRSGLTDIDSGKAWRQAIEALLDETKIMNKIDAKTRKLMKSKIKKIKGDLGRGALVTKANDSPKIPPNWYRDEKLHVICNHESKAHMREDLWRYYFSTCFAKSHGRSPTLSDYPNELLPDHQNVVPGNTKFLDRFKVQVGDKPASTVTSHISKDGHFFIHHDPLQCRAWTVREAARIQTFPDNYFFEGNRTEQYRQVGNAVPPYLAYQIAEVVAKQLAEMELG